MTDSEARVRDRQDGDYHPPILAEPSGGPIPPWRPIVPPQPADSTITN